LFYGFSSSFFLHKLFKFLFSLIVLLLLIFGETMFKICLSFSLLVSCIFLEPKRRHLFLNSRASDQGRLKRVLLCGPYSWVRIGCFRLLRPIGHSVDHSYRLPFLLFRMVLQFDQFKFPPCVVLLRIFEVSAPLAPVDHNIYNWPRSSQNAWKNQQNKVYVKVVLWALQRDKTIKSVPLNLDKRVSLVHTSPVSFGGGEHILVPLSFLLSLQVHSGRNEATDGESEEITNKSCA
jgi:hypothetical protein